MGRGEVDQVGELRGAGGAWEGETADFTQKHEVANFLLCIIGSESMASVKTITQFK